MERKALIDDAGRVENVIVYSADFDPPDGLDLVDAEGSNVGPGDGYDGEQFVPRPSDDHEWTGTEWVSE